MDDGGPFVYASELLPLALLSTIGLGYDRASYGGGPTAELGIEIDGSVLSPSRCPRLLLIGCSVPCLVYFSRTDIVSDFKENPRHPPPYSARCCWPSLASSWPRHPPGEARREGLPAQRREIEPSPTVRLRPTCDPPEHRRGSQGAAARPSRWLSSRTIPSRPRRQGQNWKRFHHLADQRLQPGKGHRQARLNIFHPSARPTTRQSNCRSSSRPHRRGDLWHRRAAEHRPPAPALTDIRGRYFVDAEGKGPTVYFGDVALKVPSTGPGPRRSGRLERSAPP